MIRYIKSVSMWQREILANKKTGTPNVGPSKSSKGYYLTLFAFVMITFATVMSIRNFPTEGIVGWQVIFFNIIAIIMFLIPASLIAAELATGWPGTGGVYIWVKEAFGERWGFTASWIQWFQMTTGFIGILAFIAGTLSYLFNPAWAGSKIFIYATILVVWWGATLLNLKGLKTYARYTTLFVVIGTIIPIIILIFGGVWLVSTGHATLTPVLPTWADLIPKFTNLNQLVLLVTFVFIYIGIEVTAAHAAEMKNVKRDYPLTIFIVGATMAVTAIVGAVVVAWFVPIASISLIAGLMQAFTTIFGSGLLWVVTVMGLLLVIGSVGEVIAWVYGPVRGLGKAAEDGMLPPILQKKNKEGVPVNLLILQAILISFWGAVFVLLPGGVNSSYWMIFALTTSVYIVMYFLMYMAAIKLRYTQPEVKRPFTIPGGKLGMWIVAGWGIVAIAFVFIISLIPPSQTSVSSIGTVSFETFMILGTIGVAIVPLIIYHFRKPGWLLKKQPKGVAAGQ
jgi:amino acid transporter